MGAAPAHLAGLGVALLPVHVCADDLAAGRLQGLLPGWTPLTKFGNQITAVAAPERIRLRRNQALLEHLRAALGSAVAQPEIDANRATLAQIERIKGVGTQLAENILQARAQGEFKDWADLIRRVKGIGASNAALLSAQGLTVNGVGFQVQTVHPPGTDPGK